MGRFGDAVEFAHEREQGAMLARPVVATHRPRLECDPVICWKLVSVALALAPLAVVGRKGVSDDAT